MTTELRIVALAFEEDSTSTVSPEYNDAVETLAAKRHFEHAASLQHVACLRARQARDYYRLYGTISSDNVTLLQHRAWCAATEAQQAHSLALDIDRSAY